MKANLPASERRDRNRNPGGAGVRQVVPALLLLRWPICVDRLFLDGSNVVNDVERYLSETGRGILFSATEDPARGQAIRSALQPLLDLRREQATLKDSRYYRVFIGDEGENAGYLSGETANEFLLRHDRWREATDSVDNLMRIADQFTDDLKLPRIRNLLAEILLEMGDRDSALAQLAFARGDQIDGLAPEAMMTAILQGKIAASLGDFESCFAKYQMGLRLCNRSHIGSRIRLTVIGTRQT